MSAQSGPPGPVRIAPASRGDAVRRTVIAILIGSGLLLLAAVIATAIVESEVAYRLESLGGPGPVSSEP
jgi:hypothetical protein